MRTARETPGAHDDTKNTRFCCWAEAVRGGSTCFRRGSLDRNERSSEPCAHRILSMDQLWGEYIPNWIAAVSTALAFIAAGIAAVFAWRSLQRDTSRDERSRALGLSAWWVTGHLLDKEVWGILVSNSASTTFHDVSIRAVGNTHSKANATIDVRTLPPGRYLVQSMPKSADKPWGTKIALTDDVALQPLTNANTRNVQSIEFTDSSALQWRWSPTSGLERRATLGPTRA